MWKNSRTRILIIDDSVDIHDLLTTLFNASGYQIHCTSNGEEALSFLRTETHLPDLILLDAQMPVMDGYIFRNIQNSDARLKDIPVVLMTAEEDMSLLERTMRPAGILKKPLSVQSLLEMVARHLAARAS